MTAKVIELALRNPLLVVLLTAMLVGAGIWRMFQLRLDAIPDLSDVQVIVTTEVPGQNPQLVDDQVTYPLASAMLSVPGATVVRGISMFVSAFGLADLLHARATEVSRGETKRARLCATLSLARPVVLLDEPFAALDPLQLRELLPRFRNAVSSTAAIVTVHQMRTAELVADRLLLLAGGRGVAMGTLAELRARAQAAPDAPLDDVFLHLLDHEGDDARA